ncbi:uncharacterized protein PHACADRAFT_263518 [Phanerochaete carnosa HHB-10118-sp]|uniref:PIN domain-containing protein n=1 Tax=Phanerochaete carnosa (strain HHB-10118-sp) TaxID=650164 RepID=K5WM99_PHACS|nr:uncharacterized protein PHACADRAFT_263518 [Phanerochaete carnosa HHB-10118-sp]EKM51412.1 hypothetical protein PHACADRAFT_263518 [Phanerochaete carnosa HHB-10118-sp]
MADKKGSTMLSANKLAMSKALGAAFLNHQVEQLEKTVSAKEHGGWRDRKYNGPQASGNRRPAQGAGGGPKAAKKGGEMNGADERRKREGTAEEKDADIVVVDASVLVHGISQVKKWCREGRPEIVIVPLEALNTLDLLKKGTSLLAQRARAASRILEAQVGTNPRIRVQRDDAFVPWDSIPFHDGVPPAPSPEWVRRTICCARWEVEHATAEIGKPDTQPKVILAVLSGAPEPLSDGAPASGATSTSPVPLPAPQPNKHEPRATGTMILQWAARAGLDVFEVAPTQLQNGKDGHPAGPRRSGEQGRRSPDDNRNPRGRRNSNQQRYDGRGAGNGGGGLVERPPAVMAMMEAISQPSRVVRVLARGEKLDPN